jgi:hypothetical protein
MKLLPFQSRDSDHATEPNSEYPYGANTSGLSSFRPSGSNWSRSAPTSANKTRRMASAETSERRNEARKIRRLNVIVKRQNIGSSSLLVLRGRRRVPAAFSNVPNDYTSIQHSR